MADYPYRLTQVMPATALVAGADNVAFAAWLNAAQPGTVADDLGPPVSFTGVGQPTHCWASSATTEAGMRQTLDYLSTLVGIEPPGSTGWWDTASLAEKLDFANVTLHPSLSIMTNGGVRLEDAATETYPEQLLATMTLHPLQSLLPPHPSQNLVWRVRADLGVITDYQGISGGPSDGEKLGYWEDVGPYKVPVTQDIDFWRPEWRDAQINGHPSVYSFEGGLVTDVYLAPGIGAGEFSFYGVVRFTEPLPDRPTIWTSSSVGGNGPGLGVGLETVAGHRRVSLWFTDGTHPMATEILPDVWYYLLVVRRLESSTWTVRLYVNGALDPTLLENDTEVPDGDQSLFQGVTYPTFGSSNEMNGDIAEFGLYRECVETSGAKAQLDAYILDRYAL